MFVFLLVHVLSIAVLVLVLDRSLRYRMSSLDQPSQRRHDPFQIGFFNLTQFGIDRLERYEYIVNRGTFQSRAASELEKSIFVFQALLPISLGNVEWNRLSRSQRLIASVTFRAIERFRYSVRSCDMLDRKTIYVKSFVVKDWLCPLRSFEYEYCFTEYEYEEIRSDARTCNYPGFPFLVANRDNLLSLIVGVASLNPRQFSLIPSGYVDRKPAFPIEGIVLHAKSMEVPPRKPCISPAS